MNGNKSNIAKSAVLVTLMVLAFKALGFVKQAVIAYVFGATSSTDIYFIAWGFVSGISEATINALLVSIVAIYTSVRVKYGREKSENLINGLLEILGPIFIIITIIICFCAPYVPNFLAPSYKDNDKHILVCFIQILAPILFFGCIELVFRAVLDSHKCFYISRLQSLIYSLTVIIACFLLSKAIGIHALVLAQYFSSICFSIVLTTKVCKYHKFSFVGFNNIPELKNILLTSVPLFVGNSAIQINQMVDKSITSGLGEGATSALSYCHTIEQFVTNIMIVNIGNIMFANYAEFVAKGEYEKIRSTLATALNVLIIFLSWISVVTIMCSKEIVSVVYYRGNFNYGAVVMTSTALIGYAISFVAVAVRDLSIKSMYAFKDTLHPMIASIISIVVNIILSIVLSKFIGIIGVSIATSVSAIVGMILNVVFLKRHIKEYRFKDHVFVFFKCLPGIVVLVLVCFIIKSLFFDLFALFKLFLVMLVGMPVYFVSLHICNVEEIRRFSYKAICIINKLLGSTPKNNN